VPRFPLARFQSPRGFVGGPESLCGWSVGGELVVGEKVRELVPPARGRLIVGNLGLAGWDVSRPGCGCDELVQRLDGRSRGDGTAVE